MNSDFSGVRPGNQHRTEPTCRYFRGFPRYSLAASLCVRHARLGAAEAGATKDGVDISARRITIARKVRIPYPQPLRQSALSAGSPLIYVPIPPVEPVPPVSLTLLGVGSSEATPECQRVTVCLHKELSRKSRLPAAGGAEQAPLWVSRRPWAREHIPGGKFPGVAAMTRFLVCGRFDSA